MPAGDIEVAGHAAAALEQLADHGLGFEVALRGGFFVPVLRLCIVLGDALPFLVVPADGAHRGEVAESGGLAVPGEGALRIALDAEAFGVKIAEVVERYGVVLGCGALEPFPGERGVLLRA